MINYSLECFCAVRLQQSGQYREPLISHPASEGAAVQRKHWLFQISNAEKAFILKMPPSNSSSGLPIRSVKGHLSVGRSLSDAACRDPTSPNAEAFF